MEDDYLMLVDDRYTAEELVEELGLTTRDIIEAFREMILEKRPIQ